MIVGTNAPAKALYGLISPDAWITEDCVISNRNVIKEFGVDDGILKITQISTISAGVTAVFDLVDLLGELGFAAVILVR